MREGKRKALTAFTVALDRGAEAFLTPELASEVVKQVMLLNYDQKTPQKARELGVHPRTFNRYQTGESAPTLHRAVKLLDSLGYEIVIRKKT